MVNQNQYHSLGNGLTYQRVEARIRDRILNGDWPVGTEIPGRRSLATDFGVSLTTIEKAVQPLLANGTLRATSRRGTLVARTPDAASHSTPSDSQAGWQAPPLLNGSRQASLAMICASDDFDDPDVMARSPMYLILTAIERMFSTAGGCTQLIRRLGPGALRTSVRDAIEAPPGSGFDAMVLLDYHNELDDEDPAFDMLATAGIPAVVVTGWHVRHSVPQVCMDNVYGGYQAASHLLDQGYRDLIFVAPFPSRWQEERIQGARNAVRYTGRSPDALTVVTDAESVWHKHVEAFHAGYVAGEKLMRSHTPFSGVIASNDECALGFVQAARESGRVPGRDFGIVGFDDNLQASLAGLTSLRPPLEALGEQAVGLIRGALDHSSIQTRVQISPHLITRSSSSAFMPAAVPV